ncbi:superoxide dismutase [Sandarakinorhabdus rubra]|uniref:superoxide dismutase n=1 Tax=Sandarakinorhabdus rubra TaxID=2672568 RepID=UPI0013D98129|nr:superoxide dismutase [Sandarakinorhabdus rubra]
MFLLPPLPYAYDALAPVTSARTLHHHHVEHHGSYVKALNALLETANIAPDTLDGVMAAARQSGNRALFNNAAQARNHSFFWDAMTDTPGTPTGDLAAAITAQMGSLADLKTAFVAAGVAQFGSGWVWLVADAEGGLAITVSHDAQDWKGKTDATPLIVCDVWEHAYYLDHQGNRAGFLAAWFDALPNWAFAGRQYAAAQGYGPKWEHPDSNGN